MTGPSWMWEASSCPLLVQSLAVLTRPMGTVVIISHQQVSLAGQREVLFQMVLRFNSSIWLVHTWFAQSGLVCGYKTCAIHPCYAAKVTIPMVISVIIQMWWSCSMTSPCNMEVPSVHALLPRSLLSWWHQQVTWMTSHPSHQVSCWMCPSMGVTGATSYPYYLSSALPDQLNDGLYIECEVWVNCAFK